MKNKVPIKNINKSVYKFKQLNFTNGLFDKSTDMCYLITMLNTKRKDHFLNQLHSFKPHSKVNILINPGYKKVKKNMLKQSSNFDLLDAVFQIFYDAHTKNYQNIICFEDDFFFDETKFSMQDIDNINNYIIKHNPHIYNLGPMPHISHPDTRDYKHLISIHQGTGHGVIYSKYYRDKFMDAYVNNKITDGHCDGQFYNKIQFKKVCYYKPICFQTWPSTENKKTWSIPLLNEIISMLKLDKSNVHYCKIYTFFGIIPVIVYIILFVIIIAVIVYFVKKNKK